MITQITTILILVLLSIIDVKTYNKRTKYIPSILTTGFIFIEFALSRMNVQIAVLGLIVGLLFYDFELWEGTADTKVFIALSLALGSYMNVALYSVTLCTLIMGVSLLLSDRLKRRINIPLIPIMSVAYLIILFII